MPLEAIYCNGIMLFSGRVIKNIVALMTLQIGNYILPLILLPYLVRVLGLAVFGKLMFAMAFIVIARTFVAYGFDLTATRQVAVNRDKPSVLSELYQSVVIVRLLMWFACFAALLVGMFFVHELAEVNVLVSLAMLILVGEILFPIWLFQGAETMALITKVKLASKALNVILVLLLVNGPADLFLVPVLEAATSLIAGGVAMVMAVRCFSLHWVPIQLSRAWFEFRNGGAVFLSQVSVHLYTTVNLIFLGFLVGPVAVAQYSIAEKIYSAARGLLSPVTQSLFPGMAISYEQSIAEFRAIKIRLLKRIGGLLIVFSVLIISLANWLVFLVAGNYDEVANLALRILGFAMLFALGSFLGPMLVVQQRNRQLLKITVIGGIIGILTIAPFVTFFGVVGAAMSFCTVQIYNTIALYLSSRDLQIDR